MSNVLPGWTANGSPVPINSLDVEADAYPLAAPRETIAVAPAPPSRQEDRDWAAGNSGPSQFDRQGGGERV